MKIELDCSKNPIKAQNCSTLSLNIDCARQATTRLNDFRTRACEELGFDAASTEPIDSR